MLHFFRAHLRGPRPIRLGNQLIPRVERPDQLVLAKQLIHLFQLLLNRFLIELMLELLLLIAS